MRLASSGGFAGPSRWSAFPRPTRLGIAIVFLAILILLGPSANGASPPSSGRAAPRPVATAVPCGSCPVRSPGASAYPPATWSQLLPSGSGPSPRSYSGLAFDPALNGLLLFGGEDVNGSPLGDTWLFERGSWTPLPSPQGIGPSSRWGATMAYDSARETVVLFGGTSGAGVLGDTWAYNRSGWHLLTLLPSPAARAFAQGAYDPALGGLVVYGGALLGSPPAGLNDTWLLGSGGWTQFPSNGGPSPGPLAFGSAAFDTADSTLLLFGGADPSRAIQPSSSTWRFDPSGWSELPASPATPASRLGATLTDDPDQSGAVLFGGLTYLPGGAPLPLGDTWLFAHGAWVDRTPGLTDRPAPRRGASAAFEPSSNGVVLVGGQVGGTPAGSRSDVWGFAAQPLTATVTVAPTAGVAPFNSTFTVSVHGGTPPYVGGWTFGDATSPELVLNATHRYDTVGNFTALLTLQDSAGLSISDQVTVHSLTLWEGSHQWSALPPSAYGAPSPRSGAQVAYDGSFGALLLFGGESSTGAALGDTWEFVNDVWINLTPSLNVSPGPRWGGGLAYDAADGYLLLFGGVTTDGRVLNDSWQFTPNYGWVPILTPVAPSPRGLLQMAYDAADQYVVLFGGGDALGGGAWAVLNDTWIFRGGLWSNATAGGTTPIGVLGATLVADPVDGYLVLFGGSSVAPGGAPGTCYPDASTWTFAAGVWSAGSVGGAPTARLRAASAFDAHDSSLVVFGGAESAGGLCFAGSDTWTYLAGAWTNRTTEIASAPPARYGAAAAYDAVEGIVVVFGGESGGLALNDTWIYPSPVNQTGSVSTGNISTGGATSGNGGNGGTSGKGSGGSGEPFAVGYTVAGAGLPAPAVVTFVATASGGVAPFSYTWNFGDSTPPVAGAAVSHRYAAAGSYEPVLTATDGDGVSVIEVLNPVVVTPSPSAGPSSTLPGTDPGLSPVVGSVAVLAVGAVAIVGLVIVLGRRENRLRNEGEEYVRGIEESKNPDEVSR